MSNNCEIEVKGNMLIVKVDLTKRLHPSGTGKTMIVGTTAGNASIPGHPGVKLGVNVFAPLSNG
jgi:hypothetical protein